MMEMEIPQMNKNTFNKTHTALRILTTAFALVVATFVAPKALAKEITVTCYQEGTCEMQPSAGDALFDKTEADNTNMLPGDNINRTIKFINESSDTCAMYLRKIYNVRLGGTTLADFPSKMFTALETSHGTAFGEVLGGYPTSNKNLQDLIDAEKEEIIHVPAFSEDSIKWLVRFDPATGNPYQRAEVWFDFDMVFECLAIPASASLTIAKTNLSWPTKLSVGDEVLYQLVVTSKNGAVNNVNVVDAPPETVQYVEGSWTAQSSKRGDIKANGQAVAPSYQSPGIWYVGNMEEDEVVTLTYRAKVLGSATNGTYKDLAWAYGFVAEEPVNDRRVEALTEEVSTGERILAASTPSAFEINGGVITDTFVGTQVLVENPVETSTKKISIPTEEIEGEVLGATTQILPATGANTALTIGLGVVAILATLVSIPWGKVKKAKVFASHSHGKMITLFGLVSLGALANFGLGSWANKAFAQVTTESLVLRVSEPKTPDNKAFIVDYVVLDIENHPVTVGCYKKNPADTFFTKLSEVTTKAGGDSGICTIGEADLSSEGLYAVKVTASANGTEKSEEVAVLYKNTGPKKPKYIEKDKVDSCEYEIKVKTANDDKTSYIEIYRSSKKDFTVGDGTRIKTVSIGADEVYEFTHKLYGSDCGSSYYAVRAFDDAGNPSDVRSEVVEELVEVEGGSETNLESAVESGAEGGILPGAEGTGVGEAGLGGDVVLGEAEREGEDETEAKDDKDASQDDPEVLGAEDTKKAASWILPLALLAFVAYSVVKSKRAKSQK